MLHIIVFLTKKKERSELLSRPRIACLMEWDVLFKDAFFSYLLTSLPPFLFPPRHFCLSSRSFKIKNKSRKYNDLLLSFLFRIEENKDKSKGHFMRYFMQNYVGMITFHMGTFLS